MMIAIAMDVECSNDQNHSHLLHDCKLYGDDFWCLPINYDRNIDPFHFKDISEFSLPWNYTYEIMVQDLAGIDDKRQRISFLIYFRVEWHDPRIQINLDSTEWKTSNGDQKEFLFIPSKTPLWLPDL